MQSTKKHGPVPAHRIALKFLQPGAPGPSVNNSQNRKPATFTTLQQNLIDQIFVRMQSNYGHLWSSRFGSHDMLVAAKIEWLCDLMPFLECDINRALDYCKKQYVNHAPTLPQFSELCKGERAARVAYTPRLPSPPVSYDETVLPVLDACRALLR